jgi:hypothetical protein
MLEFKQLSAVWSGLLNLHKHSFDLPFAWKSKNRDKSKLEYLVSLHLNILNLDNEPTFVSCGRKEVITFTLETTEKECIAEKWVGEWADGQIRLAKRTRTETMKKVLSGDRRCTRQFKTHKGYSKTM